MNAQEIPTILISPKAKAALASEVDRTGVLGDLIGGLLFGYPLDKGRRLVVSSTRLTSDVGFGRRDFSLDQTRTSRQLDRARGLDAKANYCGVWYLHRTPNPELIDEEWVQLQTLMEDPDFPFQDLVCLVLCFYGGALNFHALSFNRYHAARGQTPAPTTLQVTEDQVTAPRPEAGPSLNSSAAHWYQDPAVATRLNREHQLLAQRYAVEPALSPQGHIYYRLSPRQKYEQLSFYLSAGPGFPEAAPDVFLLIGGKPYRISTPSLGNWTSGTRLVEVADELVEWLAFSVDEYMTEAKLALDRGDHASAQDLLTVVLAINPRAPGAARMLARAQAALN